MNKIFKKIIMSIVCFGLIFTAFPTHAGKKCKSTLKTIDAIILGERVVDIAYNLGYTPKASVGRFSFWDMQDKLELVSVRIGCPVCVCKKKPNSLPNALKEMGIKRLIIEKSPNYCLYKPDINPDCALKHVKNQNDLIIEYVDFSNGLESAVKQTAKLLGCSEKVVEVMEKYNHNTEIAKKNIAKVRHGKKVVLLSGTFQRNTGKTFIRVEAAEGYSDKYMLKPLKAKNVGDALKTGKSKNSKGHFSVRSLKNLVLANPDIIVIFGDTAAVQKALSKGTQKNPEFANITALKNNAVYALPFYADCGVLEYPINLNKWACMFQ